MKKARPSISGGPHYKPDWAYAADLAEKGSRTRITFW